MIRKVTFATPLILLLGFTSLPGHAEEPILPVPGGKVGDFQATCYADRRFRTFAQQVACIKGLLAQSTDPVYSSSNPDLTLYLLTADQLVADVKHRRITPSAARVQLQKAYLEMLDRMEAARERLEREQQERAEAEQEKQHEEAEEAARQRELAEREAREEAAREAQQEAYAAAVQVCINQAKARRDALNAANPTLSLSQNAGAAIGSLFGGTRSNRSSDKDRCSEDPTWYESIPLLKCVRNMFGQVVCSTQ